MSGAAVYAAAMITIGAALRVAMPGPRFGDHHRKLYWIGLGATAASMAFVVSVLMR